MIRSVGGDPKYSAACLAGLTLCFPGWGDAAQFSWLYMRPSDPRPADLLVVEIGGKIVAGLSVVYRWIGRDDEPHELVGMLSGAWTYPEARGSGRFGQLLDRASDIARSRGATMALAFVTGERASLGQLERRSARVIEARLFTGEFPASQLGTTTVETLALDEAALAFAGRRDRTGRVSIAYDPRSWLDQMGGRTAPSRIVRLDDQVIAVLAQQGDSSIILDALTLEPALRQIAEVTRPFATGPVTIYESGPESFKRYDSMGWTSTMARIFLIPLSRSRLMVGDWSISAGDRL